MRRTLSIILSSVVVIAGLAIASLHLSAQAPAQKTGKLILRGDMRMMMPLPCSTGPMLTHCTRSWICRPRRFIALTCASKR